MFMAQVTVSTSAYLLASGETLSVRDADALLLQSSALQPPSITIAGRLIVTASGAPQSPGSFLSGVRIGDGGFYKTTLTIEQSGLLRVDTSAGARDAYGVISGAWTPQVIVNGRIEAIAQGKAYGVRSWGTSEQNDTAVAISGAIDVRSDLDVAYGVYMGAGDGFANTGQVEVFGAQGAYGVYFYQWDSRFSNAGVIRATDAGPDSVSYAVYANTTFYNGFLNTGVLQGDYALKLVDYRGPGGDSVFVQNPTVFTNAGTMIGRLDLGHLRQSLNNSGLIQGEVELGAGDDTYSGGAGTVTGMVAGGDGADRLLGGAGFDNFQGNSGADTAFGRDGDDWVVGGKDNDSLSGDAGNDLVYGNLGVDTCEGGDGNDIVRGGQDNDSLSGGAGDDYVSGDKGDDTVAGGAGADLFHTFGEAGVDRVTDFNAGEGDRVQLDPGTAYTLVQDGADLLIELGAGNRMILAGVQLSNLPNGWIYYGG